MKKGKEILGVRSSSLHARVKAYVDTVNRDNVTISWVVREAIEEKIKRLEDALSQAKSDGTASPLPLTLNLAKEAAQVRKTLPAKSPKPANRPSPAVRKRTPDAQ